MKEIPKWKMVEALLLVHWASQYSGSLGLGDSFKSECGLVLPRTCTRLGEYHRNPLRRFEVRDVTCPDCLKAREGSPKGGASGR